MYKILLAFLVIISMASCTTNDTTVNKGSDYKNQDQRYGQDGWRDVKESNRLEEEHKILNAQPKVKETQEEKFISNYMRNLKKNMLLSYKEFDETENKGWRVYYKIGDHITAYKLIDAYIKEHSKTLESGQIRHLYLHSAQIEAIVNNYKEAVVKLKKALSDDNVIDKEWNIYINGFISFLNRDIDALKAYKANSGSNLEYMSKLELLIRNFNKPYSEFCNIKLVK